MINNNKRTTSRTFEYKTKIVGNIPADNITLGAVAPLKIFE